MRIVLRSLVVGSVMLASFIASADIVSYTHTAYLTDQQAHFDGVSTWTYPRLQYLSDPTYLSQYDPDSRTWFGMDMTQTFVDFAAGITSSSSTFMQLDGYINGFAATNAPGNTYTFAMVNGYTYVSSFTLDQPGTVTMTAASASVSSSGDALAALLFYVDGVTYLQNTTGSTSVAISAGSHWVAWQGYAYAESGSYYNHVASSWAAVTGQGQIQIQSVPEPTTLAVLGLGLLAGGWVWRRQRREEGNHEWTRMNTNSKSQ